MKITQMVSFSLCSSIVIVISLGYLVGGFAFLCQLSLGNKFEQDAVLDCLMSG